MASPDPDVTGLLQAWSQGEASALEALVPHVFDDLRRMARRHLRREREGHTLEPTALVHEVYLKLVDQKEADWQNREQFFAVASRIMRRVLLDYAKARQTAKRGKDAAKVPLEEAWRNEKVGRPNRWRVRRCASFERRSHLPGASPTPSRSS